MAWKEVLVMEERIGFVLLTEKCQQSFSSLCIEYRISRKTGYKWVERYVNSRIDKGNIMIRVIALLTILACVGCQTTSKQTHKTIIPTKEQISVLIKHDRFDSGYSITVKWSEFKPDGTEDIFTAPMSSGKLNEWLHCDVNEAPLNLKSKISYLIEDEKIEVIALPGVNLISKISPVNDQTVHVTGVFSASKFNELGEIIHMSLPIDVTCNLGKSKIIYEKEIKLEQ